jgi:Ca2+-transporting ATPase
MPNRNPTQTKPATVAVQPWHTLPAERVAEALGTGPNGLSAEEAAGRLAEHGPNTFAPTRETPAWWVFLRQFKSPLILILIAVAGLSFVLGHAIDTGVIMGIVVINATIGFLQEHNAARALAALKQMTSPQATVVRDGRRTQIDASGVVVGDRLLLAAGDRVAADVRLSSVVDMAIDEASLTGESFASEKATRPIPGATSPLGDRANMAFMNTVVTRGRGWGVVVATGMASEVGRIAGHVAGAEVEPPLIRQIRRFSYTIAGLVAAMVAGMVAIGLMRGMPFMDIFLYAVSMAVSAIPEGLPIVVTVLLAVGVWRMARRRALIRHLPAVEALGATTVICSDKTGTLTRNEMTVRRVVLAGRAYDVSGEGHGLEGAITEPPGAETSPEADAGLTHLLEASRLCNDAVFRHGVGAADVQGDPTEIALLVLAAKAGIEPDWPRLAEVPFSSEQRWMATVHQAPGTGPVAYAKGALERLLPMARATTDPDGAERPLDDATRRAFERAAEEMADGALRVLALAYAPGIEAHDQVQAADLEGRLILLGLVGMIDPPRPEAIAAVRECQQAGIRVVMITGDHAGTARAIAREMGILGSLSDEVIAGDQLEQLDDAALGAHVARASVFARVAPEHKLRIVKALKARGEIVAMTGDGVNDAPALSHADIGIAMGITGTEVAKEASALVIADDNFATIVAAVEEGRLIAINLRKVLRYLLSTSLGEVLTLSLALILGMPLPLVAVQILWINLVTDGTFDKTLAMEPAESDLMRQPPRSPRAPLLEWQVVGSVLRVAPLMALVTLGMFHHALASGEPLAKAQTLAFSTLVFFQWFAAFSFRSPIRSNFQLRPNRWMLGALAVAGALHLTVLYLPAMQGLFHTVSLTPLELGTTLAAASTLFWLSEGSKLFKRRRRRTA